MIKKAFLIMFKISMNVFLNFGRARLKFMYQVHESKTSCQLDILVNSRMWNADGVFNSSAKLIFQNYSL